MENHLFRVLGRKQTRRRVYFHVSILESSPEPLGPNFQFSSNQERSPDLSKPLPSLKPVETLLPLRPYDACLEEGIQNLQIPPRDYEESCLLSHYGIRQASYAGTRILDHLFKALSNEGVLHLAPLLLYRHILDLGDSIGTLLRFGSSSTAAILLRALFEGNLGLHFMLEGNTFRKDRAASYWTFIRIKRLRNFTVYDPSTTEGKRFHEVLNAAENLKDAKFPERDYSHKRNELENLLNTEDSKPFWLKYQQAPTNKKPKHWYSLCSKARNFRELAVLIKREAEYLLLYQMLSEPAHASDVISGILRNWPGEGILVHQIRGPEEKVEQIANFGATFLLNCHHLLLSTYVPKDHELVKWFTKWYLQDYRPFYLWATKSGARTQDTQR